MKRMHLTILCSNYPSFYSRITNLFYGKIGMRTKGQKWKLKLKGEQVGLRWGPPDSWGEWLGVEEKAMQVGTKFEMGIERRVAVTLRCQSAVESPHIVDVGHTGSWRFMKKITIKFF